MLSYGQAPRNAAEELFGLLMTGRNFEAKEFKIQHQDQFRPYEKVVELMYNMHMSLAFNKPDSAIIYFEEFLSNHEYVHNIGPAVGQFYVRLSETYEGKQQFEKAISSVERHISYLKENPYSLDPAGVKREIDEAQVKIAYLKEKFQHEPIRGIVRDQKNNKVKLKDGPHIRFDAQYNGHTLETLFDTGVSYYCMMEKEVADEIGVKYKPNQDSTRLINGKPMKAIEGYIDRIEIKDIKLYNIHVLVLIDKFTSNLARNMNADYRKHVENNVLRSKQVLFGLPIMKMIGRFEFDWKANLLTIPHIKEQNSRVRKLKPAIAVNNGFLYLHMKINDADFTGFLDLGADHYLFLTYPYFFKSNSAYVKNDPLKQPYFRTGLLGVQENIERQRLENPRIYFDGRRIDSSKPGREVYAIAGINNFDGEVGVSFFKNTFAKTVIDFNSMTVDCVD
jgi:hypothetical protein